MTSKQSRAIKVTFRVCVCLVVLVSAFKLYGFLHSGTVTVSVKGGENFVKITTVDEGGSGPSFTQEAPGKLSLRLAAGTYRATAYSQTANTSKILTLKPRQHLDLSLSLRAKLTAEPVFGEAATAIAADKDQLAFVDPSDGSLVDINDRDEVTVNYATSALETARWANSSLGLTNDQDNHLYVIKNGQLSRQALPFHTDKDTALSYDITPSGTVYVSNGQTVYSGRVSGNLKRIYAAQDGVISALSAGQEAVAIIEEQEDTSVVSVVTSAGKLAEKTAVGERAAWSPSGKLLVVGGSDSSGAIYDTRLNRLAFLPAAEPDQFAWAGNSTVLYKSDDLIWSYSLRDKQAVAIIGDTPDGTINEVAVSHDGRYAYLALQANQTNWLARVGLQGQKTNSGLSPLVDIFPKTVDDCTVDYVNFGFPALRLSGFSASDPNNCVATVQAELDQAGVVSSGLQYLALPIAGESGE